MSDSSNLGVAVNNVFVIGNGSFATVGNTGSLELNSAIRLGVEVPARVETVSVIPDGPASTLGGVAGAVQHVPNVPGAALRGVPVLNLVGTANDITNVIQHIGAGNGAEAVTEGFGVAGSIGAGVVGYNVGLQVGTALIPVSGPAAPAMPAIGAFVGGGLGSYFGVTGGKEVGTYLTGGNTPDKLGSPIVLPNDTPLRPTVTTSEGDQYALVQLDGEFRWFAIRDGSDLMFPNRFMEVTSGGKIAELTNDYLRASGFEQQLADYRSSLAQDAFIRGEILQQNASEAVTHNLSNGLAPDGSRLGVLQNHGDGSMSVWTTDSSNRPLKKST